MNTALYLEQLNEFESHYQYDTTYMRELLETSPTGYEKFNNLMPLFGHRDLLDPISFWIAKIAAMKSEDCGECLQLNVRMALENQIDKSLVSAAVNGGQALPDEWRDVFNYVTAIACKEMVDEQLQARIASRYNKGQLLEFGLCISSAKFFPTIKRAAGYLKSCSLVEIAV